MKVFFSLVLFSLALASCHACYSINFEDMHKGKMWIPKTCIDVYSGENHPIGSVWMAPDCHECHCSKTGLFCCHRNFKEIPGCKAVVNRQTCQPEYYRLSNPTQRCDA